MHNFVKLSGLPVYDLYTELNNMILANSIKWGNGNQICLNSIEDNSDDVYTGVGSLTHDWDNSQIITETGEKKRVLKEREKRLHETDFKFLCNQFKGTLFEDVYYSLSSRYKLGRVRLMKSESKTCLSWHTDSTARIHYPIKTQTGCFMIIENEIMHLPQNTWWYTNTIPYHTAFNASLESRIHLVAVVTD